MDPTEILHQYDYSDDTIKYIVRSKGYCEYCCCKLMEHESAYHSSETEHIVPDGNCDPDNLALVCSACNNAKSNDLPPGHDAATLYDMAREDRIKLIRPWLADRRRNEKHHTEIYDALKVLMKQ